MNRAVCWTAVALFLLLAATTLLSSRGLTYDEPLHLEGARLLVSGASLAELLDAPLPSAPGPLFPVLHWICYPFTQFNPHLVRVVNLLLLAVVIGFEFLTLRALRVRLAPALALATVGIPIVWPSAGMALTEVPAIAMMTVATYLCCQVVLRSSQGIGGLIPRAILAGLFYSLAILGRQTYLAIFLVVVIGAIMKRELRIPVFVFSIVALTPPILMFLRWEGLVPPAERAIVGSGSPSQGLLAVAYVAICVLILAPSWFRGLRPLRIPFLVALAVFLANLIVIRYRFGAFRSVTDRFPLSIRSTYPLVAGSLLLAICAAFVLATFRNVRQRREDATLLASAGSTALMTASTVVIAAFSSRYVVTTLPFLVLMVAPYFRVNSATVFRLGTGGAVGFASLSTYLLLL